MANPMAENKFKQYLLGDLPEAECEQFDELSIVDDEFAEQLCAAENDLLEAYVRNELCGETLQHFESHYLSTPIRRERVEMVRLLYLAGSRMKVASKKISSIDSLPRPQEIAQPSAELRYSRRLETGIRWGLIAATLLLVLSTGWLSFSNYRLHNQNQTIQEAYKVLKEREGQLNSQIAAQNSTHKNEGLKLQEPRTSTEIRERTSGESQARTANIASSFISSILLLPQTRGISQIPSVSLFEKTKWVQLQLQLESDDYPQYQISIKDLGNNQFVWQSEALKSALAGRDRVVSVQLPATSLEPRNYAAELTGLSTRSTKESISSYVFKVIRKPSS